METEATIKSGGRTFGMYLKLRRTHIGIEIAMYGKRGAFLGLVSVDGRELRSVVEKMTDHLILTTLNIEGEKQ